MATNLYRNFDLLIQRDSEGNGYVARAQSPSGEGTARFVLPFSQLELEHFVLSIAPGRGRTRRIDTPDVALAKRFGEQLFSTVFAGEVGGLLRASLSDAGAAGTKLRLRMRLNDAPELADLPWEYLYNSPLNRFLSLDDDTAIVRYLELPERVRPVTVTLPLRILVIISSPTDFPTLDVEHEWMHLQDALADLIKRGLVSLDLMDGANLPTLRRQLQAHQYHILHFIGHGGFDRANQEGVLMMVDDVGRGRQVSGQQLGWLLHNHKTLALAVLNACEGARADQADAFAGTAQSLVQQGIPAVVAMQFEITDSAAKTFASAFYSALAAGDNVESSLTETRLAIFAEAQTLEWGTPVLFMRSPDGRLFDVQAPAPGIGAVRGVDSPVAVQPQPAPVATPFHAPRAAIVPTPDPVIAPAPKPTVAPTPVPEIVPAPEPTIAPAPAPEIVPIREPAIDPTPKPVVVPTPQPAPVPTPEPMVTPAPPVVDSRQAQAAMMYNAAYMAMSERKWSNAIEISHAILMLVPEHKDAQALLNYSLQQRDAQVQAEQASRRMVVPSPAPVPAPVPVPVPLPVAARTKSPLVAFALEAIGLFTPMQGLGHLYLGNRKLGFTSMGLRLLLLVAVVLVWGAVFDAFPDYSDFTILYLFNPYLVSDLLYDAPGVVLVAGLASVLTPIVSLLLVFVSLRGSTQVRGNSPSVRTRLWTAAALEAVGFVLPLQGLGHIYLERRILGATLLVASLGARILAGMYIYDNSMLSWRELPFLFLPITGFPAWSSLSSDYGSDFDSVSGIVLFFVCVNLLIPALSIAWVFLGKRRATATAS